jgi:predicted RNA-binding protein YlqC (UPF0109 family)
VSDVDGNTGDDGAPEADGNTITAGTAKAVLEHLVASLVDDPTAVRVEVVDDRRPIELRVYVGSGDMGRVIGKRGRVAHAIRTVTRAAAARDGVDVNIEFED